MAKVCYADDLVISAETEEGLKMKLNKWKTEMEAKIMVSGVNLQMLKVEGAEKVLAVTPSTVLDAHIGYTRNVVV